MVSDSVRIRWHYGAIADVIEEHEIVQRKELGSKPPTTYGYLESEDNVVRTIHAQKVTGLILGIRDWGYVS